ncbi:MAG: transposase [Pseudomonadota bacterium]|uniref:REP-associated tyrosine transposase n=1 Tax=Alcanivorax sp. TaxID=1872427 RepID=UPI0025C6A048|nr:transposase [Alcanivorax sp.]MED5239844.1 transposase [Pseudomonadota bacterium]MEE3319854.1 transposase [Pseudomonadota bacterium]
MSRTFHGSNLRKGRHSQARNIYHITTVTRGRYLWFSEHDHARTLCRAIQRSDQLSASDTLCFVVMPDHLHWLFMLGDCYSLSHTINMVKSSSARRCGMPIWQRGYHDHALRQEESIKDVARYIVANPLRAGLVSRLADYPYWNAAWL